jgi:hypothetical protein
MVTLTTFDVKNDLSFLVGVVAFPFRASHDSGKIVSSFFAAYAEGARYDLGRDQAYRSNQSSVFSTVHSGESEVSQVRNRAGRLNDIRGLRWQ